MAHPPNGIIRRPIEVSTGRIFADRATTRAAQIFAETEELTLTVTEFATEWRNTFGDRLCLDRDNRTSAWALARAWQDAGLVSIAVSTTGEWRLTPLERLSRVYW